MDGLAAAASVTRVVLADPDGNWLPIATERLGPKLARTYACPLELLAAEAPLMALIAMEAGLAPPVITAALECGSHVLAEKPSCLHARDFRPLAALADAKGLHIMLALSNRLNPEVEKARELVSGGTIGEVYGMELHMCADQTRLGRTGYGERWEASKARAGGGHLVWLGIHFLDLAMHITGSSISQVSGFTANVGEHGKKHDVEDSAVAALRFDNGTLGTCTSAYFTDSGYNSHMKIWGSKGWVHLEQHGPAADLSFPLSWYTHAAGNPDSPDSDFPDVQKFEVDPGAETGVSKFCRCPQRCNRGRTSLCPARASRIREALPAASPGSRHTSDTSLNLPAVHAVGRTVRGRVSGAGPAADL